MDVYTTSFTYPRRTRTVHPGASQLDFHAPHALGDSYAAQQLQHPTPDPVSADSEAIQKLAVQVMSMHGCHVSYQPVDGGRAWNFHITGPYQQVMVSRGLVLKECPIQVRLVASDCPQCLTTGAASGKNQGDAVGDPGFPFLIPAVAQGRGQTASR